MQRKKFLYILALATAASLTLSVTGCNKAANADQSQTSEVQSVVTGDIQTNEEIINSTGGEHAVEASGNTAEYSNVKITKTGDSSQNDEADFYGDNAAVFATDKATLTLNNVVVDTNGKHKLIEEYLEKVVVVLVQSRFL